jgi:hypothetical protein
MKTFPLLCLLFSAFAFSQTTYKSDYVNINTGDPGWASFYFGNSVTLVGDTELIIQCDFSRAELITNFQVYGKQMSSDFFPITCTEVNPKNFILDATPFTVNLTMYGYNNTPQNLTLTVDSANWHTVGKGRYAEHIGAAEIAY